MILYINTIGQPEIEIDIKADGKIVAQCKIEAERVQAEKLLLAVEAILQEKKIKLNDIKAIEVENKGGSFTSLRIGVAVANALGFALGIPVEGTVGSARQTGDISLVEPVYDREPDVGSSNK
jgi:tRNA A37 threonylcarbamoyladenosine modification protein TsaB